MRIIIIPIATSILLAKRAFAYNSSDFLVKDLDKIVPAYAEFDGTMYAGLLPIDVDAPKEDTRGELMFWLFDSNEATADDTLTIWLNGGPGCSSFHSGNLFEIAPVMTPHFPAGYAKTSPDAPLQSNEWAWTKRTNILFVEQPTGTGFSWGPAVNNESELSEDFYNFLQNFYSTFPGMASKKLYIFGESFGGMYVPSIAHKIHIENKRGSERHIDLAGIALGNGWVDAMAQGPMVIDYAYWHGMIDSVSRDSLKVLWEDCKNGAKLDPPLHDFTIPDECNMAGMVMKAAGAGIFPDMSPNVYDVTTWDTYPVLNDPTAPAPKFFNNPEVRKALHAPMEGEWLGCIPGAGRRLEEANLLPGQILLAHDKPESVGPYMAELLDDAGIRVLVYNGDRDISVCAQGSEKVLDDMQWSGAEGWHDEAPRGLWMVDNKVAGYAKTYEGLDFVVVYNSGHLVPYNVPVPGLDLITRMVTHDKYIDIALPTYRVDKKTSHASTHNHFHGIMVLALAVICFLCGVLASSLCGNKTGYSRVPNN